MANDISLIVYPAKDVDKAKKFFTTFLGTEPYADSAWYVGYKVGDREVGLDPNAAAVVSYVDVEDIAASLKALTDAGATVVKDSTDVGGGLLIAQVELDSNILGLRQSVKQ